MDRTFFTSIPMDKKHKIESFEMIGMTEPSKSVLDSAILWLDNSLHHEVKVYPVTCYEEEDIRPPNCIFVPDTPILNKLLEITAKHPDEIELIQSKLSCLDQPKPEWLIIQEQLKQEREDSEKQIKMN